MYTFIIYHPNSGNSIFEHVDKVEYVTNGLEITVSGDEILGHHYPTTCNMYLYSYGASYTVSKDAIYIIEVKEET